MVIIKTVTGGRINRMVKPGEAYKKAQGDDHCARCKQNPCTCEDEYLKASRTGANEENGDSVSVLYGSSK